MISEYLIKKAKNDINPSLSNILTFSEYNPYDGSDVFKNVDVPANLLLPSLLNPVIDSIFAEPWENGHTEAELDFAREQRNKYTMKRDLLQGAYGAGLGLLSDALLNDHNGNYNYQDAATSAAGGAVGSLLKYLNRDAPDSPMNIALGYGGSMLGGWLANRIRLSLFS